MSDQSFEQELDAAGIRGTAREVLLARQPPNPVPYRDLAEKLGITTGAVAQACCKARKRLQAHRGEGEPPTRRGRPQGSGGKAAAGPQATAPLTDAQIELGRLAELALRIKVTRPEWNVMRDSLEHPHAPSEERAQRLGMTVATLETARQGAMAKLEALVAQEDAARQREDIRWVFGQDVRRRGRA